MKISSVLILTICIILFNSCVMKEEKTPLIPLEDFFKNPEKDGYKISPDGKYFSYLAPFDNRMNLFVEEIGKDSAIQITWETDRDIAGYLWANKSRILYLKDTGGDENFHLYGVNIDGSDLKGLTVFEGVRTTIIDELEDFEDLVLVGLNKRNPQVFDPYRLNIKTGEMELLAENPGNIVGWLTDHEGKLRVAIAIDGIETSLLYRDSEQEEFRSVLTTNYKEQIDPYFFDFDNKNVYATSNLGRDKSVMVLFDIANAKELEVIYENGEVDIQDINYSKKRKVLTYVTYYTDKKHFYFFDVFQQLNM